MEPLIFRVLAMTTPLKWCNFENITSKNSSNNQVRYQKAVVLMSAQNASMGLFVMKIWENVFAHQVLWAKHAKKFVKMASGAKNVN